MRATVACGDPSSAQLPRHLRSARNLRPPRPRHHYPRRLPVDRSAEPWLSTDVGSPRPTPVPPAVSVPPPAQDWLAPPAPFSGSPPDHASATELLERRIGERLLLYAGMVLVVFAVGFFLRYAFEHDWLSPAVRVALGVGAGVAFVAGGHRLARRGYEQYGLFLCGGGFALLFLSVYAAFAILRSSGRAWPLPPSSLSAAAAAVLADRHVSLPMALMAVCGGFAAPFLVSTGADAQIALFTYDGILIAATMYLARRRAWPSLNLASFVFTLVTVDGLDARSLHALTLPGDRGVPHNVLRDVRRHPSRYPPIRAVRRARRDRDPRAGADALSPCFRGDPVRSRCGVPDLHQPRVGCRGRVLARGRYRRAAICRLARDPRSARDMGVGAPESRVGRGVGRGRSRHLAGLAGAGRPFGQPGRTAGSLGHAADSQRRPRRLRRGATSPWPVL